MKLTDKTVRDLLDAFRSSEPTPGGGSASALAGSVGSALLAMVAGLRRPRAAHAEEIERLAAAGREAARLSDELAAMVDRDAVAYDAVMAAYTLPKATDDDKRGRAARIQEALADATRVPLEVMRLCADAAAQASTVRALGNVNASSDVQVALELLGAGRRGAKVNVEINLESLEDARLVEEIRRELARLSVGHELPPEGGSHTS